MNSPGCLNHPSGLDYFVGPSYQQIKGGFLLFRHHKRLPRHGNRLIYAHILQQSRDMTDARP
jgi:hypothetical protein